MGLGLISPTLFDNGFDRAIDNMIDSLFYTPAVANRAFGVNRVNKEDFEIAIDGGKINVQYRQKEETPNRFFASSFNRSWQLPRGVTEENVSAEYQSGILHVSIDKTAIEDTSKVRHINIK